jgi:AmpD protein
MRGSLSQRRRACSPLWHTRADSLTRTKALTPRTGGIARIRKPRLAIDAGGVANLARQVPSPNRDARPAPCEVSLVVVHGISLPPGQFGGDAIESLFTNGLDAGAHPYFASIAALRVSAHFLVRRGGELIQFVPCSERAWHAGQSAWRGRPLCNDFSVGIELEGCDDVPYAGAQYAMLARLVRALARRYPIEDVVGHSDVAPGRKTDPGPAFDWARFRRLARRRA